MMDLKFNLEGMSVYVVPAYTVTRKRSWRERLFTLPWRPKVSTESKRVEMMRDGEVIVDKLNKSVHCNAATYAAIEKAAKGVK